MTINFIPATKKQLNYIDILVIDLSFTIAQRKFHLTRITGRPINAPDELSKNEASKVISTFKEWKENKSMAEIETMGLPDRPNEGDEE